MITEQLYPHPPSVCRVAAAAIAVLTAAFAPNPAGAQAPAIEWSEATTVHSPNEVFDHWASIDSDGDSTMVVVRVLDWPNSPKHYIAFSRSVDGGRTWNVVHTVDPGPDTNLWRLPQLEYGGGGTWIATWSSWDLPNPTSVYFARSIDNGLTWSAPAPIEVGDTSTQLTSDGSGTWLATWGSRVDEFPPTWITSYARSTDAGESWSVAKEFPLTNSRIPALAYGNGVWIAIWTAGANSRIARSTDRGQTWSELAPFDPGSMFGHALSLTTDGEGTWIATAMSHNIDGGQPDSDIVLSRSSDNGLTWSAPQALNTNAATDMEDEQDMEPSLMTDGDTWICVWHVFRPSDLPKEAVYAVSRDDGQTWSDPTPIDPSVEGVEVYCATTGLGDWAAVWSSLPWVSMDLYVSHASFGVDVWVDFAFTGSEQGTRSNPYNSLAEADAAVPIGGSVRIVGGSHVESVRLDRPATYRSAFGSAQIGSLP